MRGVIVPIGSAKILKKNVASDWRNFSQNFACASAHAKIACYYGYGTLPLN